MRRAGTCPACAAIVTLRFKISVLTKKTFVLRIDDQAYHALEKWAADEFRSVNGQIEMLIDKALKEAGRKREPTTQTAKPRTKKG